MAANSLSSSASPTAAVPNATASEIAAVASALPVNYPALQGNTDFDVCCLKALGQWQGNPNVDGIRVSPGTGWPYFNTFKELADSSTSWPCGAQYANAKNGSAVVEVTRGWCTDNCNGFEHSSSTDFTQWIQPVTGFILPAAIFCMNIPWKEGFRISNRLFPDFVHDLADIWKEGKKLFTDTHGEFLIVFTKWVCNLVLKFSILVLRFAAASALGLVNVVHWILLSFAMAAPMMLGGLYEATLDRQVLRCIEATVKSRGTVDINDGNHQSMVRREVHLLLAVLVGNLELAPQDNTNTLNSHSSSAYSDVMRLMDETFPLSFPSTSQPSNGASGQGLILVPTSTRRIESRDIRETKHKLKSMLECQADFGATVAAPVAFYLGSFAFSIVQNVADLGDNDNSHALAFGEWWMTIPHLAIVAGCLLAGNNPHTLEAVCSAFQTHPSGSGPYARTAGSVSRHWEKIHQPLDGSTYQPVWMWRRGMNKLRWVWKIQKHYGAGRQRSTVKEFTRQWGDAVSLEGLPFIGPKTWAMIISVHTVLINLPWILAFLTSYYTPTVGLSCRSCTFLIYFLLQSLLTGLWLLEYWLLDSEEGNKLWTKCLTGLLAISSGLTVFIGTVSQLVGLYRTCLCEYRWDIFQGPYWLEISTNSWDDINYARSTWTQTGGASMALLGFFCYLGWWYQRYWRARLIEVSEKVLVEDRHTGMT